MQLPWKGPIIISQALRACTKAVILQLGCWSRSSIPVGVWITYARWMSNLIIIHVKQGLNLPTNGDLSEAFANLKFLHLDITSLQVMTLLQMEAWTPTCSEQTQGCIHLHKHLRRKIIWLANLTNQIKIIWIRSWRNRISGWCTSRRRWNLRHLSITT